MNRSEIVVAARSLMGTPFRHQGRVPGLALDCAGLVIVVAQQLGIEHFDVPGYGRRPHRGLLEQVLADQPALIPVNRRESGPGDVLLMRFGKEPQHLAILAESTIIHSWEASGKVCEHGLDDLWLTRIVRVYRFAGIDP